MIWVIEYSGIAPCWIKARSEGAEIDITFHRKFARRFVCKEDANHEILRLGLSGQWAAQQIVGVK